MKTCPQCRTSNHDEAAYCRDCGARLSPAAPPAGSNPDAAGAPAETPAQALLKRHGSSPVFFAAAVALAVSVLFGLVSSLYFFGGLQLSVIGRNPSDNAQHALDMISVMTHFGNILVTLLTQIPSVLTAVGMFLFYSGCRRPGGGIPTTGLTLIKTGAIIWICLTALLALLMLLAAPLSLLVSLIASGIRPSGAYYLDLGFIFMNAALVLVAVLFALFIVYLVMVIGVTDSAAATARTGRPGREIPLYVIAGNYVLAGLSVLAVTLLPAVARHAGGNTVFYYPGAALLGSYRHSLFGWIGTLAGIVAMLLISNVLRGLRRAGGAAVTATPQGGAAGPAPVPDGPALPGGPETSGTAPGPGAGEEPEAAGAEET